MGLWATFSLSSPCWLKNLRSDWEDSLQFKQAPNTKHQITNKFQCLNIQTKPFWSFEIGFWNLFVIWDL
jgi:hypothetical protein